MNTLNRPSFEPFPTSSRISPASPTLASTQPLTTSAKNSNANSRIAFHLSQQLTGKDSIMTPLKNLVGQIAKEHLSIPTLECRNSDDLDFQYQRLDR